MYMYASELLRISLFPKINLGGWRLEVGGERRSVPLGAGADVVEVEKQLQEARFASNLLTPTFIWGKPAIG